MFEMRYGGGDDSVEFQCFGEDKEVKSQSKAIIDRAKEELKQVCDVYRGIEMRGACTCYCISQIIL